MRQRSSLDNFPVLKLLGLGRVAGLFHPAIRPRSTAPAGVPDNARRHHAIISGTGRAGTTFLVKLLTRLGLDTGYRLDELETWSNCSAGLERDLRDDNAPYIVKSPWICDYIEEVAANRTVAIDFAIIPMRVLEAAAESRRHVERETKELPPNCVTPPGGLWHTTDPSQQESVLAHQFHKLFVGLAKTEATIILLHYPRLTRDPLYLYHKLQPMLGPGISVSAFRDVFAQTADTSLVHRFTENDA
jgi:hypothetical protein